MPPSKVIGGRGVAATASPRARIVVAIPARYGSCRLPGKPLLQLRGRPIIEHVYRRCERASGVDRVVVLTDDRRILEAVEAFGGPCEMTPVECRSGTDRIAAAARRWRGVAAVINVQGDEPLIEPEAVEAVARHLVRVPEDRMVTLAAPATEAALADPDQVKVVTDRRGYALYFSRAGIPFPRHPGEATVLRHVGVYGYRRETLLELAEMPPTPLERSESLEQLRALENGLPIRVLEVAGGERGVDTAEDLSWTEAELARRSAAGVARRRDR